MLKNMVILERAVNMSHFLTVSIMVVLFVFAGTLFMLKVLFCIHFDTINTSAKGYTYS